MKAYARIPMKVTGGFAADPDPSTNPADVPTDKVFNAPGSLPVDGAPNTLQFWLDGATPAQAASVEVWGLDDDSNVSVGSGTPTTQFFKPNANQRWSKLVAATAVTSPVVGVATGKLFAGFLYFRQTASTLTTATTLKVALANL